MRLRVALLLSAAMFGLGCGLGLALHSSTAAYWVRQVKAGGPFTHTGHIFERGQQFRLFPSQGDVVFVGDSLTEQADLAGMFPTLRIVNRGISGDTSAGLLLRLDTIIDTQARIAVVLIGGNDAYFGVPAATVGDNVSRLLHALDEAHMASVLVAVPNGHPKYEAAVTAINEQLRGVCRAPCTFLSLPVLDTSTYDGSHLTAAGYRHLTEGLRPILLGRTQ